MTEGHRFVSRAVPAEVGEWPTSGPWIAYAVGVPIGIVQFADTTMVALSRMAEGNVRGHLIALMTYGPALLFAAWAIPLGRRRGSGTYLAAFGLMIAFIVAFQFKSDFIRAGTFDLFEESSRRWVWPIVGGAVFGILAGGATVLLKRNDPKRKERGWPSSVGLGFCVASTVDAFRGNLIHPSTSWSAFAPTRHWALLSITVILATVSVVAQLQRVANDE